MKLITRDTDYAVRALCDIAKKKGETVSVTGLVQKLKIPRPFLRKILQILTQEEILLSVKGQGGGFQLAASPGKILLIDLMKTFQGELKLNDCMFKKKVCPNRRICPLRSELQDIEQYAISKLRSVSIASLMSGKK